MSKKEFNEEARPVILHDHENEKDYTLEFNRDTIRWAEGRGFDIDDLSKFPETKIREFFFYAFRMHHQNVSREKTDKIIDEWGGIVHMPDGLLERLGILWAMGYSTMTDAEAEEKAKNPKVTVEF
jgi:hypothetical protein